MSGTYANNSTLIPKDARQAAVAPTTWTVEGLATSVSRYVEFVALGDLPPKVIRGGIFM